MYLTSFQNIGKPYSPFFFLGVYPWILLVYMGITPSFYAQNFRIQDGTFVDPNGQEFIPIGANVNPWNYFNWEKNWSTPSHQSIWTDCWKFNFMRAPVMMQDLTWDHDGNPSTPNAFMKGWVGNEEEGLDSLARLIDIYTPKGVVVMLNAHNFVGRFPSPVELAEVKDYYRALCDRFGDNPYVWFNLFNEPGEGVPASQTWLDIHQELITLIRDEKGANNMIVCTGTQWGQEAFTWDDNDLPTSHSAFLSYGEQVQSFNGKTYDNIAFDLHIYDQWANDEQFFDNKLRNFLSRCQEKGFAMLIGEVGTPPMGPFNNEPWKRHFKATQVAYEVALKEFGIGIVQWHWDPEDNFTLIAYEEEDLFGLDGKKQNGGIHINDCENPTNLSSWGGAYFWRATHEDGFGLQNREVSSSSELADSLGIVLYPNPVQGALMVTWKKPSFVSSLYLQDAMGRILRNKELGVGKGNRVQVDVSDLAQGLYFCSLIDLSGEKHTQKIMIVNTK